MNSTEKDNKKETEKNLAIKAKDQNMNRSRNINKHNR